MSLVPAFEIGVLNAWILMLYFPLYPIIMMVVDRLIGIGDIKKKTGSVPHYKHEEALTNFLIILLVLAFGYAIFLPLKLGTVWFYIGIPIYLCGFIMFFMAITSIVKTPHNEPFTTGIYRCSRHPMILFSFLMHLGVSIATASWIFILFSVVYAVLWSFLIIPEEKSCLKRYGDTYRKYMDKTPKWIGVPKR